MTLSFAPSPLRTVAYLRKSSPGTEALAYTYEIVEGALPVKNYKSKLWLEVDDEPDRSIIYWQSDFDANGASDDEAKQKITTIRRDGVKGIKKEAFAAYDAREAASGNAAAPAAKDDDD